MAKRELPQNVRERDGKYYYRYDVYVTEAGKRKRRQKESAAFPTANAAAKEGKRITKALLEGSYVDKSKTTVTEWSKEFLKWYASTGRRKKSTTRQRASMAKVLNSEIGGLYLHEVTEDAYQDALSNLSNNYDYGTLLSIHSCGKLIFEHALRKGRITNNPCSLAYVPKRPETFEEIEAAKRLPRFLEIEELFSFFKALEGDPQFLNLFQLLAFTGLRVGELQALFEDDYNDDTSLNVSKNLDLSGSLKFYELTTPKNKSSVRVVELTNKAIDVIKRQRVWRREFSFSKGEKFYKERKFMFVCQGFRAGYPLHYTIILDRMKAALCRAGLPTNLSPHSLRHTYTSLMAEAGADLDTIQAQLGHKLGSKITRAIYLHVTKAREKRDVGLLDALLDSTIL